MSCIGDTDHFVFPSPSNVKTIYEGTTNGDPARRLLIDFYVHHADLTWVGVNEPSRFQGADFLEELDPVLIAQRGEAGGCEALGASWGLPC
jgi:hypothetical protein